MPAPRRGNNGNHRPLSDRALRDLSVLDMVEAAAEMVAIDTDHQAITHLQARVARRERKVNTLVHRAHMRMTLAQAREDNGPAPTPLADVIAFPARRTPQPPTAPMAVAA